MHFPAVHVNQASDLRLLLLLLQRVPVAKAKFIHKFDQHCLNWLSRIT